MNDDTLLPREHSPAALVPAPFAEKAMASLMQLHSELMEEKERRVDLYRRLMDKEQANAELRMYIKLLEERLGMGAGAAGDAEPAASVSPAIVRPKAVPVTASPPIRPTRPASAPAPSVRPEQAPASSPNRRPTPVAAVPPASAVMRPGGTDARLDGWKSW